MSSGKAGVVRLLVSLQKWLAVLLGWFSPEAGDTFPRREQFYL